jgi:phosphoribosyl-AMP cyclohydrolase / phosphoribosyl-ATP pyrophosphohydrolase
VTDDPRGDAAAGAAGGMARARAFEPDVRFGPDGLVPGIVQDRGDGRVLMVGYLDAEALAATRATGDVHFHSRSRDRLWRKGETSGSVLRVVEITADCDGDALLLTVDPAGPTCHRGTRSCFDLAASPGGSATPRARPEGFAWLETLWATIASRAAERPDGSYTTRLLAAGVDGPARKVGEEAIEVILAARDDAEAERTGRDRAGTGDALAGEVADLVYHSLVLLAERGMVPGDVLTVLRRRAGPEPDRGTDG